MGSDYYYFHVQKLKVFVFHSFSKYIVFLVHIHKL